MDKNEIIRKLSHLADHAVHVEGDEPYLMSVEEGIALHEAIQIIDNMSAWMTEDEAYAVAEFIDSNIFDAIRTDDDWDSLYNLRNLIHGYEKCCIRSGYVGMTDSKVEEKDERGVDKD